MSFKKNYKEKIILGVDPGSTVMGYAVIKATGNQCLAIQMGVLRLKQFETHYQKLKKIDERMQGIIQEYKPDVLAVEAPFYGKNVQSMLKLGRAQGAVIVTALRKDIPVFEYEPRKVKKAVTGSGSASKEQISKLLRILFNINKEQIIPLDATDALGVAFCHFVTSKAEVSLMK